MSRLGVLEIMSGRRGVWPAMLRAGLAVASGPYWLAMKLRRWAYRKGLRPVGRADVPVISVGNITAGGTGKTPMVAWLVRQLQAMGKKPAVLIRGYKAVAGRSDEALLLGAQTGALVMVNPDRMAGAASAVSAGADVLVMDDGFQHCRLARDLDIVLIDATNPFGFGHCLPRGLLREPLTALGDADAVVISRADELDAEGLAALRGRLALLAGTTRIAAAVHRPLRVVDEHGAELPVDALAGRSVLAFCGIANPEHFFRTLRRLGAEVIEALALDDHVRYDDATLQAIADQAARCGAALCVTTQKDAVKLAGRELGMRLWQLAVEMEFVEGRDALLSAVRQAAGLEGTR